MSKNTDLLKTIGAEVGIFALGKIADSLFGSSKQPSDLNDFLSYVKSTGVASPNLFRVDIFPPKGMTSFASSYAQNLSLICDAAALPSLNVLTRDAITYGPSVPIPYNVDYGKVSCSFIVEQDMAVKQFFDKWFWTISDPSSYDLNFAEEYQTTIIINQLNRNMEVVYSAHLFDAYPSAMNQMNLNYTATNQSHRLEIGFVYKKWLPVWPGNDSPTSEGNMPQNAISQEAQTFAYNFPKDITATSF